MNLQWTGGDSASPRIGRTGTGAPMARPRPIVRPRDDMDRAVDRMLADARGKCGVARGGRWTRDMAVPGRNAETGGLVFGPGRAGIHTDQRHRRPSRVA